jgi:1-phosphofructokinase family hexose kinase
MLTNPAVDVIYGLDEIHPGTTATALKSRIVPAGKAVNVARVVKALGEEVCVVGIVHAHNRDQFLGYLDDAGISSHVVVVPGATRINVTIRESKTGQTTHLSGLQAAMPSTVQQEALESVKSHVHGEGDICVFAGSLPAGLGNDYYQKIIPTCKEKGAFCLLDTSGKALKFGVRAKPHMIKPNLEELEEFFGETVQGVHHIALKGKRLVDMGIEYVFISLGSDGMIAIHENDCLLCGAPPIRAVDTVGCGDALVAGLMTGYCRKFSFTEMCRLAVACGASKALHSGAGAVDRNEVWQLMEDVKIKSV